MSKQDVDAVKIAFDDWCAARAAGMPEHIDPFEVFAAEHILKDYNLSDDDIQHGLVGKSLDGGCDGFYFLVGGQIVYDDDPVPQQEGLTVNLILIQAKLNKGFSPLQVEQFDTLTDDVLDLARDPKSHRKTYHSKLLGLIRLFKRTIGQLKAPRLVLDYYYVSTVDAQEGHDCHSAVAHIATTIKSHFSRAVVQPFHFVNAARLYTIMFERPKFEKQLQCTDIMDGMEGYIALVRLADFYSFLRGDDGELIERIFDDNVRGFQRSTRVNRSILHSLRNYADMPQFWLLNNGITILASKADQEGGKVFRIVDPQIVNGLQTSRQIFDYFKSDTGIPQPDDRRIVVRIIEKANEDTREEIIRATNNQNPMPAEALYTTFRIHKQLEVFFASHDFYYERRKGYWRDKKKPIARVISAVSLVQAVVAIMKGHPDTARARPREYINNDAKRYSIFGHDDYDDSKPMATGVSKHRPYDFEVYLRCLQIVSAVRGFLGSPLLALDNEAKRNILFYLARWSACSLVKHTVCSPGKLLNSNLSKLTDEFIEEGFEIVRRIYHDAGGNDEAGKNPKMAKALEAELLRRYPRTRTPRVR